MEQFIPPHTSGSVSPAGKTNEPWFPAELACPVLPAIHSFYHSDLLTFFEPKLQRAVQSQSPLLIVGPEGSGKSTLARALYNAFLLAEKADHLLWIDASMGLDSAFAQNRWLVATLRKYGTLSKSSIAEILPVLRCVSGNNLLVIDNAGTEILEWFSTHGLGSSWGVVACCVPNNVAPNWQRTVASDLIGYNELLMLWEQNVKQTPEVVEKEGFLSRLKRQLLAPNEQVKRLDLVALFGFFENNVLCVSVLSRLVAAQVLDAELVLADLRAHPFPVGSTTEEMMKRLFSMLPVDIYKSSFSEKERQFLSVLAMMPTDNPDLALLRDVIPHELEEQLDPILQRLSKHPLLQCSYGNANDNSDCLPFSLHVIVAQFVKTQNQPNWYLVFPVYNYITKSAIRTVDSQSFSLLIDMTSWLISMLPVSNYEVLAKYLTDSCHKLSDNEEWDLAKDLLIVTANLWLKLGQQPGYRSQWAHCTNLLAMTYTQMGNTVQAVGYYESALVVYKSLAAESPKLYKPEVAVNLCELANLQYTLGDKAEALTSYHESLLILRELAAEAPTVYLPELTAALCDLARVHQHNDSLDMAEAAYNEALQIQRALAYKSPNEYLPQLIRILFNWGDMLSVASRKAESRVYWEEALNIAKILADKRPEQFESKVASIEHQIGKSLAEDGFYQEAIPRLQMAVHTREELAAFDAETFAPLLAESLLELALCHLHTDDTHTAEQDLLEAFDRINDLPYEFGAQNTSLGLDILSQLGVLQRLHGKIEEALATFESYRLIVDELANSQAEAYLGELAYVHNQLAKLFVENEQFEKAFAHMELVFHHRQTLYAAGKLFAGDIARTLHTMAYFCLKTQRLSEARQFYRDALNLYRGLYKQSPEKYLTDTIGVILDMAEFYTHLMPDTIQSGQYIRDAFTLAIPEAKQNKVVLKQVERACELLRENGIDAKNYLATHFPQANTSQKYR